MISRSTEDLLVPIFSGINAFATRRLLPVDSLAEVEVSSSTTRSQSGWVTIQATVKSAGAILRAEQRASSPNAAIDSVVDILQRKIAKYKSQTYRSKRAKRTTPLRILQAEDGERAVEPGEGATTVHKGYGPSGDAA